MSIGGIMRTSVSGMNAQATRLSTVSENIANSDTTGYKQSETEFSSLVLPSSAGSYNSGAVEAQVRHLISEQGGLSYTGNDNSPKKIDIAIQGNGFIPVGDGSGSTYVTRAGSFTQLSDGTMVNAAGFTLQGYPVTASGTDSVLNGFAGLVDVNLKTALLSATPSTEGTLTYPLNSNFQPLGDKAAYAQSAAFVPPVNTGYSFNVIIDGKTSVPVSIAAPVGAGAQLLAADVVKAINNTAGLAGVASINGSGYIVLTATGKFNGPESTISLSNVNTLSTSGTATPAAALTGFTQSTTATLGAATPADYPSQNPSKLPNLNSTVSASLTVYNNGGEAVKLDFYYTKTSNSNNTWELAVYDSRNASTGTSKPFPYSAGPLAKANLAFDSTTKTLTAITPDSTTGATAPGAGILGIDLTDIDGSSSFQLKIGDTTQFAGNNQALVASANGNPAEVFKTVSVGKDGMITATFPSGTTRNLFKVPLAMVNSPDSMTPIAGNVYQVGIESGTVLMGTGGKSGFGDIIGGALEDSTVDLASELTTMIESQRSYTANSKVFQTGSEILDVLVNLKR